MKSLFRKNLIILTIPILLSFDSVVQISTKGEYRYIKSNGIPDHEPGRFPNKGNPNEISSQSYNFKVARYPKLTGEPSFYGHNLFGVAINGVIFDPGTAEFWQNDHSLGLNYEALSGYLNLGLDEHNAHVQPNGAYHYHGIPNGLVKQQDVKKHSNLIGYAADGFPIYVRYGYSDKKDASSAIKELRSSYRVRQGERIEGPEGDIDGRFVSDYEYVENLGDLDECNGRFAVTPEYPKGTYYYVLTEEFPFVPRCHMGIADESFNKQRGAGSGHGGGRRRPPPHHHRGGHHPPPHFHDY